MKITPEKLEKMLSGVINAGADTELIMPSYLATMRSIIPQMHKRYLRGTVAGYGALVGVSGQSI